MIRFFASPLATTPESTFEASGTLSAWLDARYPQRTPEQDAKLLCVVDGEVVPQKSWDRVDVSKNVDLIYRPQGGSELIAIATLGWASTQAGKLIAQLLPDIPGAPKTGPSGSRFSSAEIKANTPRLNSPIPEGFGRWRRYPDYLTPPRRRFVSKTEQEVTSFLCVGKGSYQISSGEIYIGETAVSDLIGTAEINVYDPGENVGGDAKSEWWHTAQEVSATSVGGAGLNMDAEKTYTTEPAVTEYMFDADEIRAIAGEFPSDWETSMRLRIELPREYVVSMGGTGGRNIISGDLRELEPFVGMAIEIAGDNAGDYVISSYTAGSVSVAGTASTLTGSAAVSTLDYSVTPLAAVVTVAGVGYSIALGSTYASHAALVSALNAQLPSIVVASIDGSNIITLTEQSPYRGAAITIGTGGTPIMGESPSGSTGTATVRSDDEIELDDDEAGPVTTLDTGLRSMSIGFRGLAYLVDSIGPDQITVSRLDDGGDVDAGWAGFRPPEYVTDASISVDDSTISSADWTGPYLACPEGEICDQIQVDVFFPRGLSRTTGGGSWVSDSVSYQVGYREHGSGDPWTVVQYKQTERTNDQIGFSHVISLGSSYRPEVRVRRLGSQSSNPGTRDEVQWYALLGRIVGAPTEYSGVTTVGVKVRGGKRISGQTENRISVICTRELPTLSAGTWTAATATRDISAAVRYIAQSIGYTDSQIDMDELQRLHDIWSARGDTFDFFFDETVVSDALNTVLRAGFAELTVDRGRIRPTRDEIKTTFEHMYTPQNMTRELVRSFSSISPDENDGVDVEYMDGKSWTLETVECRLTGDLGQRTEKLKLDGVTDRDRAWRIGMRRRRAQKYRRWEYRFSTELDARNSGYMSYVAVADDVPGYGKSSILQSISGETLTISEPVEFEDGTSHIVAIRNPDGTLNGPYTATPGANDYEIVADGLDFEMPPANYEPPHVLFGTLARWSFPAIVSEVSTSSDDQTSVRAFNYDARVYADDDNNAPS